MTKDNLKLTIKYGYSSLPASRFITIKKGKKKCPHKKTVAINEKGHAGIFCVDCGEQLEKEC